MRELTTDPLIFMLSWMDDRFTTLVVILDLKSELLEIMLVLRMDNTLLELKRVVLEMMDILISPLTIVLFLKEELRSVLELIVLWITVLLEILLCKILLRLTRDRLMVDSEAFEVSMVLFWIMLRLMIEPLMLDRRMVELSMDE